MAILGQARVGKMRVNAARLNWFNPLCKLTIGGTDRTSQVRRGSVSIQLTKGSGRNRASLRVNGTSFTPAKGQDIKIGLGSISNLLFAGVIVEVAQTYEDILANVIFDLSCEDYGWLLDRRQVFKRYESQDAAAIFIDLAASFTSGFTTTQYVKSGLGTVTSIEFAGDTVSEAFTKIAKQVTTDWRADENKALRLPVADSGLPQPRTIDATETTRHGGARVFRSISDLRPIRTRVIVIGAGGRTLTDVGVGATTFALNDVTPFAVAGGDAVVGGQRITYTGKSDPTKDNIGSVVAGVLTTTPTAPTVALTNNHDGRVTVGTHTWKITFVLEDADGETSLGEGQMGTASGSINVTAFTTPGSAPTPAAAATSGAPVGTLTYKVTFVNKNGETIASGASSSVAPAAVSTPGNPTAGLAYNTAGTSLGNGDLARSGSVVTVTLTSHGLAIGQTIKIDGATAQEYNGLHPITSIVDANNFTFSVAGTPSNESGRPVYLASSGVLNGTYNYKVSYVSSLGETLASSAAGTVSVAPVTAPTAPTVTQTTGGNLTLTSTYRYKLAYVTQAGTGAVGAEASLTLTGSNNAVSLTNIPTSTDTRVIGRKLYRTQAGGSSSSRFSLVANLDNSGTTYTDNSADTSIQTAEAAYNEELFGGAVRLTSIPTSGDSRTTARRIYRLNPGESLYKLVGTLGDDVITAFFDNTPNIALGSVEPAVGTYGGKKVNLTSIPTGPTGTTGRKLYRTEAGGSKYKYLGSIPDNATTTFTDNRADEDLGEQEPDKSTADGGKVALTAIPLGPVGTVERKIYRTEAGGTIYRYLATIKDNVTTVFDDLRSDDALGDETAAVSTIKHVPGSTTLRVLDLSKFQASGWVKVNSQVLQYTGRDASSGTGNLTGIPASGVGSITAKISWNSEVINAPFLSGVGSLLFALDAGAQINIVVTRNDTTAQTNLAALEGGDGIHEHTVRDASLLTVAACQARGDAELALFKNPQAAVEYATHDTNTLPGRQVVVSLGAPTNVSGTFKIQTVAITDIEKGSVVTGRSEYVYPLYRAFASDTLFTLEELLKQIQL